MWKQHFGLGLAGAGMVMIPQSAIAQVMEISGVRLNPTEEGLEIILDTSQHRLFPRLFYRARHSRSEHYYTARLYFHGSCTIAAMGRTVINRHASWRNRLQVTALGERDRANDAGVDPVAIDGFITVDYMSGLQLGPGTLEIGIENLFNEQYFPLFSQITAGEGNETENFAARGRMLRVGYRLTW